MNETVTAFKTTNLLVMTSPPEAKRHRPLLSWAAVLTAELCLLTCWNLNVSRGEDDEDRTI